MQTNLPGFTAEAALGRRHGEKYGDHIRDAGLAGYLPASDSLFWSPPDWLTRNLWVGRWFPCRWVPNIVCDPPTEPGTLFGDCHEDGTYRLDCTPPPR
jgi:hypothetical protein